MAPERGYDMEQVANEQCDSLTRECWRGKPWIERIHKFRSTYVQHEAVRAAKCIMDQKLREIDESDHKGNGTDFLNEPKTLGIGMMLIGESGAGKSAFASFILERHPRVEAMQQTFVPAIYFRIPPNVSPKAMAQALLKALGHRDTKGNATDLFERCVGLCKACGVKIILIDDFQDIPARRVRGIAAIGDWIRQLIDAVPALVIAMGTPDAEVVRDSNEQVRRRMQATARLLPFLNGGDAPLTPYGMQENMQRWQSLLRDLDRHLPMAESSELDDPMTALLLLRGSNASYGHLNSLLIHAMEIAVSQGMEKLTRDHLHLAFGRTFGEAAKHGNPFSADYLGDPLTHPGQAFHKKGPK